MDISSPPPDMWERYLEPQYHYRAMRLALDAHKDPLQTLTKQIESLPQEDQEWILRKAAAELYRL